MFPDVLSNDSISISKENVVNEIPTLTMAFLGDSVYSLLVREYISLLNPVHPSRMHSQSVKYVNASFQASAYDRILDILSDEEMTVLKRGRNVHTSHTPKNSTQAEYHKATALEVLFGYLYIDKQNKRIKELFTFIMGEVGVNE